jgi:small subunit ribosomal protein S21
MYSEHYSRYYIGEKDAGSSPDSLITSTCLRIAGFAEGKKSFPFHYHVWVAEPALIPTSQSAGFLLGSSRLVVLILLIGGAVAKIFIDENESLEKGLKRFKRMREREGIVRAFKNKQYYVKPSDERREKKKKAIRRLQRKRARNVQRRTRY